MRGLTFKGPGTLALDTVADPRIESRTDAVVRVRLAAICGSDLHVYRGRETGLDLGTVMGHEFVGEVVEVGRDVRGPKPGERVVSPFTTSCGRCFYCRDGLTARCSEGELFGWVRGGAGLGGAQAEYVRVPLAGSTLVRVPASIPDEEALLLGDVLSTGYFCARQAGVRAGGSYVVVGCGPVGLMAVVAARELGASSVFAIDTVAERLALAARFGAIPLDLATADPVTRVREATDGRGADAVLEVVGSPQATRLALDLLRPGGTLSSVGVHGAEAFPISPVEAYDKNLTLRMGRCPARAILEELIPLLEQRKYDLASIFSHRLPLADGPRGYDLFDRKLDGCTKVALIP